MEKTFEEKRFDKIFGFIVVFGSITLGIICLIVFRTIPKDNQQSANMALAFCMSAFTGLSGYLIGASPDRKKDTLPPQNAQSITISKTESITDSPEDQKK